MLLIAVHFANGTCTRWYNHYLTRPAQRGATKEETINGQIGDGP
jgi:hypothetical protein